MSTDLFGNEIIKDELLRDRFIEPPFTRLDSVSPTWQKRKKMWRNKGIKSECGRESNALNYSDTLNNSRESYTGTSIFDPVICELMYYWFCPEGGYILDPFAGGSVRGIVANYLGFNYVGVELREEQVQSNIDQGKSILPADRQPRWVCGDSDSILNEQIFEFDMVFSCPPYMNLEVYSDLEQDLSNMSDEDFTNKYESIISKSCAQLKKGGYAIFVVGDVRDKKTGYYKDFLTITKLAFYKAGMKLYNEAIYLENGLNTSAMRAASHMKNQKLVKVHQNILIFKKP
jgi:hypothetical protein